MTHTLLLHQDPFEQWRWLLVDEDRNPTGASELGHPTRAAALDDAARYLLLEPTDNPDAWTVHTTTELLVALRNLANALSYTPFAPVAMPVVTGIRALLQIPGGAR